MKPITRSSVPHHYLAPGRAPTPAHPTGAAATSTSTNRRLLPDLPALSSDEAFLHKLGTSCVAELPTADANAKDDASGAAGWTILGQFIAHDITADRSPLVDRADVDSLENVRRQKLNLEFLYGSGPVGEPYLYDVDDSAKLLLGLNDAGRPNDLQRNAHGIAIIVDPRNDSHLLVS